MTEDLDDDDDFDDDEEDDSDTIPVAAVDDDEPEPSAAQQTLRAALLEQRDDLATWTVLGDRLQEDNDPRGALVMLMLERERAPSQKLYDAEVAYRKQHAAKLVPAFLRKSLNDVAWRRGFPVAIPIGSLDGLRRAMTSPSLAFVESVRISFDLEDWNNAERMLRGKQLPWRRVRIDVNGTSEEDELNVAPWFAAMPALERLDLGFQQYDEPQVVFTDAQSPRLRSLSIRNATSVDGIEDANLPALEEVFALGSTPFEGTSKIAVRRGAYEEDEDYENRQEAFIAIGQLVDASLVEEVAHGTLASLYQFSIDIGHVVPGPYTVLRLSGAGATQLLPYGLAVALERVLAPRTPIVLFHSGFNTGSRAFALGTPPLRRNDGPGNMMVRGLLDVLCGVDPGPDLHDDLEVALACSTQISRGAAGAGQVLFDIDPGSLGQVPEIDEPDFYDGPIAQDYELDLYAPGPEEKAILVETTEAAESPTIAIEVAAIEQELAVEGEDVIFVDEAEDDDDGDEAPEGRDAWVRLLALWAERAADPDDDYFLDRWPDPEAYWNAYWEGPHDFDALPDDAACENCERTHTIRYPCAWCGGKHCGSCTARSEDAGTIWCVDCLRELSGIAEAEVSNGHAEPTYNDEIFDGEPVAPPELVAEDELGNDYDEEWA